MALSTLSLAVFSVQIVSVVAKGETPFYPNRIGPKEIYKILNKFNYEYDFNSLTAEINKLLRSRSNNEFNSEYYDAVRAIQSENDKEFNMVWNDFNYYQPLENKNDSVRRYLADIRYYVYCRVYTKHNELVAQGEST